MPTANSRSQSTIGPLRWTVPSATTKGLTYEVAADTVTGELRCNCLAGVNGKACWHVKAVASGAIGKPRVRICLRPLPATAPAPQPVRRLEAIPVDDLFGDGGAALTRSLSTRSAVAS